MATKEHHKELTAAVRSAVKSDGILARVLMSLGNEGSKKILVVVPSSGTRFEADQIRKFCAFAKSIGMTFVRGLPIDPDHEALLIGKMQWDFYIQ